MLRRRVQFRFVVGAVQQMVDAGDGEIDFLRCSGVVVQPFPGCADGVTVYGVGGFGVHLSGLDDDSSGRGQLPPGAVQPAESLPQGVQAGAFGHQSVEVQVGADFQSLGGYGDQGPRSGGAVVGVGGSRLPQGFHRFIPFPLAHSSGDQNGVGGGRAADDPVGFTGCGHPVGENRDGGGALYGQVQRGGGQFLGHSGVALRHFQSGRLAGHLPSAEGVAGVGNLGRGVAEGFLFAYFRGRGGRHYDGLEGRFQRRGRPLPVLVDGAGGLQEGLRAVGFVQDDDAVVGSQPGVHRPGALPLAVGAEQQG